MTTEKDAGLHFWLALFHIPGIGPASYHYLLQQYQEPEAVFKAPTAELLQHKLSPETIQVIQGYTENGHCWLATQVQQDLAWSQADQHRIITCQDPAYPELLKHSFQPPPLLFVAGNCQSLNQPQLAIVGSRNPSHYGREIAFSCAKELADLGIVITSGLALGIDAKAHEGALAAQSSTIAVMGTGLNQIYPVRHQSLAQNILATEGALVSEFALNTPPCAQHFPRRNRIISGLSLGVLVVEAAVHSGSLITARLAMEQGKEVFAIPGSIHNPMSKGCHRLIRDGAKLVENVQHILEELKSPLTASLKIKVAETVKMSFADKHSQQLWAALDVTPLPFDALVQRLQWPVEQISQQLTLLELEGHIELTALGYSRKSVKL